MGWLWRWYVGFLLGSEKAGSPLVLSYSVYHNVGGHKSGDSVATGAPEWKVAMEAPFDMLHVPGR
jgi:hypothetical protein